MIMHTKTREDVLKTVKDENVKFIRFWFTDILGFLKSFAITVEELEGAFEEGMGFDGSSIEGFARIEESDMTAMPDPNTFTLVPWHSEKAPRMRRAHGLFMSVAEILFDCYQLALSVRRQ